MSDARAWDLLGEQHFRWLWIANGLYFAGQQIVLLSAQWFILEQGAPKTALGIAALIQGTAVILLSPFGGVLAERSARRSILIYGRIGLALPCVVMALLTFFGVATLWHALLSAALLGAMVAVTQPATATFIHDIVARGRIPDAIALNASGSSLFNMAGPALGGVAIALSGVSGAYMLGGVGFLVGIAFVGMIPILGRTPDLAPSNPWAEASEGVRYVTSSPLTLWLMGFALLALAGSFPIVMRAVYAREVLNVGAAGLGLMGAAFGAGAVVSALFMILFLTRIDRMGLALMLVNAQWVLGTIIFALSTDFALSLFTLFVMGMVGPVWQATIQTMLQTSAPAAMRSRVMSIFFLVMQSAFLGQFLGGALADLLGNVWSLLIGALVQGTFVVIALIFASSLRAFRLDASGETASLHAGIPR